MAPPCLAAPLMSAHRSAGTSDQVGLFPCLATLSAWQHATIRPLALLSEAAGRSRRWHTDCEGVGNALCTVLQTAHTGPRRARTWQERGPQTEKESADCCLSQSVSCQVQWWLLPSSGASLTQGPSQRPPLSWRASKKQNCNRTSMTRKWCTQSEGLNKYNCAI